MVFEPKRRAKRRDRAEPGETPVAVMRKAEREAVRPGVTIMQADGMTYQQIASALEIRKVPRPGGGKWTRNAVDWLMRSARETP